MWSFFRCVRTISVQRVPGQVFLLVSQIHSTKETCDRIYSTAQIYLTRRSDMKVQFSNDTITETHNAVEISQIAGRVTRAPSGKQGWKVGLELNCGKSLDPRMLVALPTAHKAERECAERRLVAYRGFAAWVTQRAQ
jgi:hypothetical protein